MTATPLTPRQTRALFDILTHYETYAEIEGFKFSDAVTGYGYPFARETVVPSGGWRSGITTPASSVPGTPRVRTPAPPTSAPTSAPGSEKGEPNDEEDGEEDGDEDERPSTSPLLQTLLTRFVLKLPGLRDLPRDFWAVRVQGLLARLGDAELSESYDKGALGTRKVLATGASGILEMLSRGTLGGVRKKRLEDVEKKAYDQRKAEDLVGAWDDFVDGLIYGDMVDKIFDHLAETDDLEAHSPTVKAAAEYAIIHLATFLHHIFVLSPEGQYLLKLIENVHNLIPYKMVKQTLRVGNAATMISGMMRLLLAKLSVTSVTNWIGLTANADDGMNLLQRIISLVLAWDAGEFRKSADKIERAKERPSDEMLQAIRQHISQGRDEHETVRKASQEHSQSIITAIFNATNPKLTESLTEGKHTQCIEYYSALLSARDRDSITTVFCRQPPDLFTAMMKDLIGAYEPLIRTIHSSIDLREHVEAGQALIDDFIKTSKPKKPETGTSTPLGGMLSMFNGEAAPEAGKMASVDDYVELLMRNRGVVYRWVHSLASKCPDVWKDMRVWAKEAVVRFRQDEALEEPREGDTGGAKGAGKRYAKTDGRTNDDDREPPEFETSSVEDRLNDLFRSAPTSTQTPILDAINKHDEYLSTLHTLSLSRLQRILDNSGSETGTMAGPGMYLSRWQALIDCTPITPGSPRGEVRLGKDVKHALTMGKPVVPGAAKAREMAKVEMGEGIPAPDVEVVVREMKEGFRALVQDIGGS